MRSHEIRRQLLLGREAIINLDSVLKSEDITLPTKVCIVPEKHLLLSYSLCQRLWLCGSQQTVENSSRDGTTDHLTCLLGNLYAGQEATVRTEHRTTDWFQIGKVVHQGCILSPCLFKLYAEYIMRNAGLNESQAGIKIAGRIISNFRYADDTTLMAESEAELKSPLMRLKEKSEKAGLQLSIQKLRSWHLVPSLHGK